ARTLTSAIWKARVVDRCLRLDCDARESLFAAANIERARPPPSIRERPGQARQVRYCIGSGRREASKSAQERLWPLPLVASPPPARARAVDRECHRQPSPQRSGPPPKTDAARIEACELSPSRIPLRWRL